MPAAAAAAITSTLVSGETMIRPPASRTSLDFGRVEHGAGADQHPLTELPCEPLDAVQRLRRIERHFDDPDATIVDGIADRFRFAGRNAADNRDQRTLSR